MPLTEEELRQREWFRGKPFCEEEPEPEPDWHAKYLEELGRNRILNRIGRNLMDIVDSLMGTIYDIRKRDIKMTKVDERVKYAGEIWQDSSKELRYHGF